MSFSELAYSEAKKKLKPKQNHKCKSIKKEKWTKLLQNNKPETQNYSSLIIIWVFNS